MPPAEIVASDNPPAIVALLRRGKVGLATVRFQRGKHWELDFGRFCGKRFRLWRNTATKAYRCAIETSREIKQHGQCARLLTTAQRIEAAVCMGKLRVVKATLTEAVDAFLKTHPLAGGSRTLLEVALEVVKKKTDGARRPRYVEDLNWKLRAFEKAFSGRTVQSITTQDMEEFIADHPQWSAVTQRSYVQAYNVLFNYAVKRGYRSDNPCQRLELPKAEHKEPDIFTIDQVRQMMAHTETTEELGYCRPYVAICTFAGVRPEEFDKLRWEQIDFENKTITVLGANAKCRARRVVDMSPNLLAWLKPVGRVSGEVGGYPVRQLRLWIRTAMGLKKWPHDVMRHSFGSYHFGKHRDEGLVKNQMGHTDDGRMFFNHYRVLVQPKAATEFWEIYPRASSAVAA